MWVNNADYPYSPEKLLIGCYTGNDGEFYKTGIETERHAITIAGAGSGKGVAVIIPN
jgi:type IV secretory pathway TraG/TraD family ATPase VirD4